MPFQTLIAVMATLPLLAAAAALAEDVKAVTTTGSATLTMCQSWLVYSSCRSYNRVEVPQALKVGQTVVLEFGSNTKTYRFPVARIDRDGQHCTVYSEKEGDPENINRFVVDPCSAP
jgi:hypothetical protein